MTLDSTATVVLVHGAWHGAWCWDRVVDRLSVAGIAAVAVDLPCHGADDGLLSDLCGDAARVGEVLDRLDSPTVLVVTPMAVRSLLRPVTIRR